MDGITKCPMHQKDCFFKVLCALEARPLSTAPPPRPPSQAGGSTLIFWVWSAPGGRQERGSTRDSPNTPDALFYKTTIHPPSGDKSEGVNPFKTWVKLIFPNPLKLGLYSFSIKTYDKNKKQIIRFSVLIIKNRVFWIELWIPKPRCGLVGLVPGSCPIFRFLKKSMVMQIHQHPKFDFQKTWF